MQPSDFLTEKQVCALLHVTDRTIRNWRADGEGPPFVRTGPRLILYRRTDLEAWLAQSTVRATVTTG